MSIIQAAGTGGYCTMLNPALPPGAVEPGGVASRVADRHEAPSMAAGIARARKPNSRIAGSDLARQINPDYL